MARKLAGASSSMTTTLNLRSFKLVKLQAQITGEAEKILNEYMHFRSETDRQNDVSVDAIIDALITERLANEKAFLDWKNSNPKNFSETKINLKKKKADVEEEVKNIEA
ncbi:MULTISPECIES: hypothetical protein [Fluviispira]|uniref:Uncharacterized protein n=1 Tax=Fluviispira sanaruensis TaxID=2493639 RepID=A0A4P2VR04_FLUSA|nr:MULTISPECIES: hypothetical protein [Fluviispira]BBH54664.1 hypothetical protein JCM31447_31380 [Fluviispira sanaruensis]